MPTLYYKDAQRQAQKELRACTARGQHPYLPVLDEFLPPERIVLGVDLGIQQIPLAFVVGTRTAGRTRAFARNFMPLVPDESEFSEKWKRLCAAHLEEGIRDPILVYEYLNRYYVEEGNKRVSVLKFFGADAVAAHVIRIPPEQNGQEEVLRYNEYVAFHQYSHVNFLEFSKRGSYQELQQLLGKQPGQDWSEDERRAFASAYYYFRRVYEACGGKRLSSTVGDAMLAYIRVYGYQSLRSGTAAEIKKSMLKMWEDIVLQQEPNAIDVKLAPGQEKEEGFLSKVLPKANPVRKVAFLHDKAPKTSGWTYGHELGRTHVQMVFQGEIETTAYYDVCDRGPDQVIEEAVRDGNTTIFTTSPRLLQATLHAAVEHPKVIFLNCALNQSHRYMRTYYARMYEAKFIAGAVAGVLSADEPVGYICDYPIYGQLASINAFALGLQLVKPQGQVYLEWSSAAGGVEGATWRLRERGISLISSLDLTRMVSQGNEGCGLSRYVGGGRITLAMPFWRWGVYYESILRRIRSSAFQSEYEGSSKALNYYWGMSAGVVELRCTSQVPAGVQKLAALLQQSICGGCCDPFRGPLCAQGGRRISGPGQSLGLEQIINMDWLAENVVGGIPAYDELSETGKATVGVVGIDRAAPAAAERKEAGAAKEQ
ncbi:MAG: BMP family ABC transporter substrate-binding protein [Oscillospiraceae bacterium]|nr:BMP family ABC transporter substrate-binding protein [Oscillospiraceae bacterium]